MKFQKLLLIFLISIFLASLVPALMEAPEEYRIQEDTEQQKIKIETKKQIKIPSFDEPAVVGEATEEIPLVVVHGERTGVLPLVSSLVTLVLLVLAGVLLVWNLVLKRKTQKKCVS